MAKIKTKKYVDLAELIKWACVNEIANKRYVGNKGGEVYFNGLGKFRTGPDVFPEEIFTIEVEEKIDEDTKIPTLIELFVSDYGQIMHMHFSESINGAIGDVDDDAKALSKAFYILNDDYTMALIWREGEFVE